MMAASACLHGPRALPCLAIHGQSQRPAGEMRYSRAPLRTIAEPSPERVTAPASARASRSRGGSRRRTSRGYGSRRWKYAPSVTS